MPQIEHVEVATGTIPPFVSDDHTDSSRLYIIARQADVFSYHVMKYSLHALLDLSRAMSIGANVDFSPVVPPVTVRRHVFSSQIATGNGHELFNSASGYRIDPMRNKP